MKTISFKTVSILCFCGLLYSCNSEKKQFSDLLVNKDLKKAYEFKSMYPETTFHIDSLIQELEYRNIKNSQSIPDHIKFINDYPRSLHLDSVKIQLYNLEWDNLKKKWSVDGVKEFIGKYPTGPDRSRLDEWLFNNSQSGTFLDNRDNKQYNWIKIGDQIWMTPRLEYQKYYQKLVMNADYWWKYSYDEMSDAAPEGWHIASHDDWVKAIETILKTPWDKISIVDKLNGIKLGRCFLTDIYEKEDYDVKMLTGGGQYNAGVNYKNIVFWSMSFDNSGQIECICMYDRDHLYFSFDRPYAKHTVLCVKDSK